MKNELRKCAVLELRAVENNGGEKIIEGHAAVFNQCANIGGEFYEVIQRGAFDKTDLADVLLFVNHDHKAIPLARTTSGTMTLTIDDYGLAFRASLDVENNPAAQVLYTSILRGDIQGCSFSFIVADDEWQNLRTEMPTRIIRSIAKVFELSCCAEPAYSGTEVHAEAERTLTNARQKVAEQVEILKLKIQNRTLAAEPKKIAVPQSAIQLTQKQKLKAVNQMQKNKTFDFERAGATLQNRSEHGTITFPNMFSEQRTLTFYPPSGMTATIATPTYSGVTVNPDSSMRVSSIVDAVKVLQLNGGDSFRQPFSEGVMLGYYTQEIEEPLANDVVFGVSEINRTKITAYVEISNELEKLVPAAYAEYVYHTISASIRRLIAKEILFGVGESGGYYRLVGIFNERAAGLSPDNDLEMSAIRDTTLDEILYAYDGVADGGAVPTLVLSKADLKAFASVRTSTKAKFYDVQFTSADSGTISGVKFILSDACKPLMTTLEKGGADDGEYCLCFGNLQNYLLAEFSPLDVKRSGDFKFRQGMTCFRGSCNVGGNTVARNSFVRVKKKA